MGLQDKITAELDSLTRQDKQLDSSYAAAKANVARRLGLLRVALTKITPEIEALIVELGVQI